ncbi:sigma-70 family RNA polymerase sigma factor [Paenibacillus sp. NPDC058071]|uniref:sigma-70 family RNA polymerase sigma factor n=1 Tax=Paenibacillus sp. NPDC058071 TaxID=3346326 RepID=UPI0036D89359
MKETEDNLVQLLRDRNEKAVACVIEQYGGLLASIVRRHIPDGHHDCQECLDDVLLAVWRNIGAFDPERSTFKNWIAAIAKYKAIDYRRKQIMLRQKQFPVSEMDDAMLRSDRTSDASAEKVEELLDMLPAGERAIFEQYYLEGKPSDEIAAQYAAKKSWVHNKLSRGRKLLKERWMKETGSEGGA